MLHVKSCVESDEHNKHTASSEKDTLSAYLAMAMGLLGARVIDNGITQSGIHVTYAYLPVFVAS